MMTAISKYIYIYAADIHVIVGVAVVVAVVFANIICWYCFWPA